jgi:hypothetical protein
MQNTNTPPSPDFAPLIPNVVFLACGRELLVLSSWRYSPGLGFALLASWSWVRGLGFAIVPSWSRLPSLARGLDVAISASPP